MAFQFTCPQGHWLEGEEAHVGQQCRCPQCGSLFVIPPPAAVAADLAATYEEPDGGLASPEYPAYGGLEQPPAIWHIPCPNGHELETPAEMIGQEVLCPHCGVQFQLRERDSVESKRFRAIELARIEQQRAKTWLNWSIVVAVVVVLAIIGMVVIVSQS